MREMTKDVTIGERTYRLGKMSAGNASWVLTKVMGVLLTSSSADGEGSAMKQFMAAFSRLTREDFGAIQSLVLASVFMQESNGASLPVAMADGKIAIKELQTDVKTVMMLTMEGLMFNISPFFDESESPKE